MARHVATAKQLVWRTGLVLVLGSVLLGALALGAAAAGDSADAGGANGSSAGSTAAQEVVGADTMTETFARLTADARVRAALDWIESHHEERVAETLELVQVPSSPFQEQVRAEEIARRFQAAGLEDVHIDAEGNVLGTYRGAARRPKLVLSAHLDTVFPPGYDPTPRIDEEGVIHAPGIGDDTAGLTALLAIARALRAAGVETGGDIVFVATVGEEGAGDLRGAKHLFATHQDIDGFFSLDDSPAAPGEPEPWPISYNALGSKRFEFRFSGPGGHSWLAFGTPSAVHAMGRAIAHIADMQVPAEPKTSFSASVVSGGSSVNAIAAEAVLQTDTRSADPQQLERTVQELLARVQLGVAEENARWGRWEVSVEAVLIGDRPSGQQSPDSPLVQAAVAAARALGHSVPVLIDEPVSTDSNVALSLGVPAATVGRGGINYAIHTPAESWDPRGAWRAVQNTLLTAVGLVGLYGVTDPLLPVRP